MILDVMLSAVLGPVVIWFVVTVFASLLAAFIYPCYKNIMRHTLQHKDSFNQASTLLVYGFIPPIAAVLVVVLLTYPQLSSRLVPDHCHWDTCDPHLPEIVFSSSVGTALVLLSVVALVAVIALLKLSLTKANRLLRTLNTFSQHDSDVYYRVIESAELLAWCVGIWRPKIYLSRGLVEVLSPQQLQVVVVHELIHIERRDNLKKWLLRYATIFWPPWWRRAFLKDFSLHTERTCELLTASRVNNPTLVAAVMQIISEKADGYLIQDAALFEEKKVVIDECSSSSVAADSRSNLWAWLLIIAIWIVGVALLTGLTHLGLEWATGQLF